jgi:hypothetical protein
LGLSLIGACMSALAPAEERTFIARLSGASHGVAHIQATSWVEAAILYAELMAAEPGDDGTVSITIEEPDGVRHCLRIDADAGEVRPC